jgi:hypothetical protein
VDFWNLFTRLGEAQILLPAALLAGFALVRRPDARPLAAWWLVLLCAATFVTTASTIAFIGWGVGSSEFNFTGVSGHAMFAAAIYPLLLGTLASHAPRAGRNLAIAAGCALALMVGVSRVVVGAHSVSEVVAGLLLGGGVSALALAMVVLPRSLVGPMIPIAVGVWFAVMPIRAPASQTHSMVTELSLKLSGRSAPYTRSDMLRGASVRQSKLSGWLAYELPLTDRQASAD